MIPRMDRKGQSITAAYEAIQRLIVEGRLGPGSRLVERELAEHLNTSRSPVRSALLRLEQEGYVLSRTGARARLIVAPLTRADVEELYTLLGFLDGEIARGAALMPAQVREKAVAELKKIAREMDEVAREVPFDVRRFFDLDAVFHQQYLELPYTPRLMTLYRATRPQADRYRFFYTTGDYMGALAGVSEEHQVIIAAIEQGDPEGARRAARNNWERAAARVYAIMDIIGERGTL